MRLRAAFVMTMVVLLMIPTTAAIAAETLSVSDTTPGKGQLVTLRGSGCVPNSTVAWQLDGTTYKNGTSDDEGDFSVSTRIPYTVSTGAHTLGIRCLRGYPTGSTLTMTKSITVHGGITVQPTTSPFRGQTVTVSGRGCRRFQTVAFKLDARTLRTSTAGSTGAFSRSVTIPTSATRGFHDLRAVCGSLDQAERIRVR